MLNMYTMAEVATAIPYILRESPFEIDIQFKGDQIEFDLFGDYIIVKKDMFIVKDVNDNIREVMIESIDPVMNFVMIKS